MNNVLHNAEKKIKNFNNWFQIKSRQMYNFFYSARSKDIY